MVLDFEVIQHSCTCLDEKYSKGKSSAKSRSLQPLQSVNTCKYADGLQWMQVDTILSERMSDSGLIYRQRGVQES